MSTEGADAPQCSQTLCEKQRSTKYYKQTYRKAWENMPDFKGWLTGVSGEPQRAYCVYCQRSLHAHRLSLLKHTCTIKHQKAAQLHISKATSAHSSAAAAKRTYSRLVNGGSNIAKVKLEFVDSQEYSDSDDDEDCGGDMSDLDEDYHADNGFSGVDEGFAADPAAVRKIDCYAEQALPVVAAQETIIVSTQSKSSRSSKSTMADPLRNVLSAKGTSPMPTTASTKPPISTHVLDTTRGEPVAGLQVTLYRLIDGRWTFVNEGYTSPDGRFADFIQHRSEFLAGRYKLHFHVGRYFEAMELSTLYPFIEIVFDVASVNEHYHIPILLNPFGYTTYRGS